jgi:alkyl sulfatase BDS1-like metallo-beta-lactamase superfamily hydrolase
MSEDKTAALPVGDIVKAAKPADTAVAIRDFIFCSGDLTNSYLVTTPEGDVAINVGTVTGGPGHRARYRQVSGNRLRKVLLMQSHIDHYGGLEAFLDEDVELIVQRRFVEGVAYRDALRPYYGPLAWRIWGQVLGNQSFAAPDFPIKPDVEFADDYAFTLGGRRFQALATPGGETTDALCVWLPDDGVLFSGNLLGPAYLTVPNVNTIRCDKPRSALEYIRSVDRVRALGASLLITGHGDPIEGAEKIAVDLKRMRDAVLYIHDRTVAGMNAGKSVGQLMREITLPPELALHEWYGTVAWTVRTIWEEYTGWFHQDRTTALYEVPQSAVHGDLVALAGAERISARAREHLDAGRPLEALHLVELALSADHADSAALTLKAAVLTVLLERAGTRKNLNETMWLKSEVIAAQAALAKGG